MTPMLITEKIFQAFLKCETKSYLKFSDANGIQSEYSDWQHNVNENYKQKCVSQLLSDIRDDEYLFGATLRQALNKYRLGLTVWCKPTVFNHISMH